MGNQPTKNDFPSSPECEEINYSHSKNPLAIMSSNDDPKKDILFKIGSRNLSITVANQQRILEILWLNTLQEPIKKNIALTLTCDPKMAAQMNIMHRMLADKTDRLQETINLLRKECELDRTRVLYEIETVMLPSFRDYFNMPNSSFSFEENYSNIFPNFEIPISGADIDFFDGRRLYFRFTISQIKTWPIRDINSGRKCIQAVTTDSSDKDSDSVGCSLIELDDHALRNLNFKPDLLINDDMDGLSTLETKYWYPIEGHYAKLRSDMNRRSQDDMKERAQQLAQEVKFLMKKSHANNKMKGDCSTNFDAIMAKNDALIKQLAGNVGKSGVKS